jgi:malate dehydrogenase (quinone)
MTARLLSNQIKQKTRNIVSTSTNNPDVVLVGAGIMSATLAVMLKEIDPSLKIEIYEVLGSEAQESSNAWNNAGRP